MAMTFHCDIVSAEKEIFSGRVTMLSATGTIGELGIMPGHAPLLTGIRPGPVRLRMDNGEEEVFFASGGYLEVQPGVVTVLADMLIQGFHQFLIHVGTPRYFLKYHTITASHLESICKQLCDLCPHRATLS